MGGKTILSAGWIASEPESGAQAGVIKAETVLTMRSQHHMPQGTINSGPHTVPLKQNIALTCVSRFACNTVVAN